MAKTYFIGLGGSGLKTVAELYKKLRHSPDANDYMYTYIDTDNHTKDFINTDEVIIKERDFVPLGNTNPFQIYSQAYKNSDPKSVRLREWAIPQKKGSLDYPNERLSDGAKAIRMIGRFGVYREEGRIKQELEGKLRVFKGIVNSEGKQVEPDVWVFASMNGGTGSSMTLDILYWIDRLTQFNIGMELNPNVKLVLFMPKAYIDKNDGNNQYYLNAYASMWELNAFRLASQYNTGIDSFGPFAAVPPEATWTQDKKFPLFKFIIPVDVESDNNNTINLESLYPTVAEMVYYLNMGKGGNSMISNLSNETRLLNQDIYKHDDTRCEWTTPLIAYGYRVIKKPNDELRRYLKTRGMLELVKFGLLGKDVEEKDRETVKVDFASNYIMPCIIDSKYCKASGNSLQAKIEGLYSNIFPLKAENLEAKIVINRINQVEDVARSLSNIEEEVFEEIQIKINEGTSEAIHDHGLVYTRTLLDLVDDHFLEAYVTNELKPQLVNLSSIVATKVEECRALTSNLNRRNKGLCVAAFNEYKQFQIQYQTTKSAINIIEKLTKPSIGYLEILRRGGTNRVGLNTLINASENALNYWQDALGILQKEFIESSKNAFTTYVPSLNGIAKDNNNQDWPNGSKFDEIYINSILDFDKTEANKIGGKHIPVRNAQGNSLCIKEYLNNADSNHCIFVELALKNRLNLGDSFNTEILQRLEEAVDDAISKPGRYAAQWMAVTLEKALTDAGNLPKDQDGKSIPRHTFINQISKKENIHVLYPQKSGSPVPDVMRFIYCGASVQLAQDFGYNPKNDTSEQFVEDADMEDKFLIIKMPVGLDFYSYSYFSSIERIYNQYYDNKIKPLLGDYGGCHIHRSFNMLDISLGQSKTDAMQTLWELLYCQALVNYVKENDKMIYNQIFGINDLDIFSNSTDKEDIFADLLSDDGEVAKNSKKEIDNNSNLFDLNSSISDDFINVEIKPVNGNIQIVFHLAPLVLDTNNIIQIDDLNRSRLELKVSNIRSADVFTEELVSSGIYDYIAKSVEEFKKLRSSSQEIDEVFSVYRNAIKNCLLDMGTKENYKVAALLKIWSQDRQGFAKYKDIISNVIQNF